MPAYGSCAPAGETPEDEAIANALRPYLNGPRMGRQLDAGRVACARVIVETVKQLGLPPRAAVIAVTAAVTESTLRNFTEAVDHDSLGLFQQRPSQGWGSPSQVTDPVYATNAFLAAMMRQFPNNSWMYGDINAIVQAVQGSAFPGAYNPEVHDAELLVGALWSARSGALHEAYSDESGWHDNWIPAVGASTALSAYKDPAGTRYVYTLQKGELHEAYSDESGWHDNWIPAVGASTALSAYKDPAGTRYVYTLQKGELHEAYNDENGWHDNWIPAVGASTALSAYKDPAGTRYVYTLQKGELHEAYADENGWHDNWIPAVGASFALSAFKDPAGTRYVYTLE
jgi:hypothetical protein